MQIQIRAALLLLSAVAGVNALAPSLARAAAPPISPAQQEAIFAEQKQLVLRDQRDRLQAIATAEQCVKAATASAQLMGCLVQEHQQSQRISTDHHAAMLAILQRHGIHPPQAGAPAPSKSQP